MRYAITRGTLDDDAYREHANRIAGFLNNQLDANKLHSMKKDEMIERLVGEGLIEDDDEEDKVDFEINRQRFVGNECTTEG